LAETSLVLATKDQFTLDSKGGEIQSENGKIKINVPENTFSSKTVIQISKPGSDEAPSYSLSGRPFSIKAVEKNTRTNLHQFETEIEIESSYADLDVPEGQETNVYLYWYNPGLGEWEALPSSVDPETKTVTGSTTHFSVFDVGLNQWQAARTPTIDDFQVSGFTGAATYSLPIEVLAGPGGLQPSLSLTYNSQVVDQALIRTQASWVGMGWSLETGSIELNAGDTPYPYDDTYFLNVAGVSTRLINQNGTFHAANDNFWKFDYDSTAKTWKVWDKTGNIYFFETVSQLVYQNDPCIPQLEIGGAGSLPYRWELTRVRNIFGQEIQYSYAKETKNVITEDYMEHAGNCSYQPHSSDTAVYPATITYANNRYRIYFERENRPDYVATWVTDAAHHGFERTRLKAIYIQQDADGNGFLDPTQSSTDTVRKYTFTYETDPAKVIFPGYRYNGSPTGLVSTLRNVREFGQHGIPGLPEHTFTYDGLHLTKAENGYGGRVEYSYDTAPWHAEGTVEDYTKFDEFGQPGNPDCGDLPGWYPTANIAIGGCGENDTDAYMLANGRVNTNELQSTPDVPMIRPGGVYRYITKVGITSGRSVQLGVNANGTGDNLSTPAYTVSGTYTYDFTLPVNAYTSQAVIQTNNGPAAFYNFKIELLPSFYRVTEKRVYSSTGSTPYTYTYSYQGAAMNDTVKSNLVCDPDANDCTSYDLAYTEFRGHQSVTVEGPDYATTTTEYCQDDYCKGMPEYVITKTPNGAPLQETYYNYTHAVLWAYTPSEYDLGYERYWVHPTSTETRFYANNGSSSARKNIVYGYESGYGNLISQTEQEWNGSGWISKKIIDTSYPPYVSTDRYLVSLPGMQNISDGNHSLVAETIYLYDGNSSYTATPSEGKLTSVVQWVSSGTYSTTSYGYDSWGNQNTVTTYGVYGAPWQSHWQSQVLPSARTTTTAYDPIYHAYPVTITNPLQQTTSITYDYYKGGLPISETDANQAMTTATYDAFGRMLSITRPGDTSSTLSMAYSDGYNEPIVTGFQTTITQRVNASSTYTITRTYDGLGRQTSITSGGITVDTIYESPTVTKQSVPYTGTRPNIFTTTTIDLNAHTTTVTATDGSVTTTLTNGLTTTVTEPDAGGGTHSTLTVQDVWGRTISVTPPTGPGISYTYDALGNLLTTSRGPSTTTTITYNRVGQKLTMSDPDMGNWSYTYDAVGNLKTQTDARGCILTLSYDALNRLTNKSSSGSCGTQINTTYTYDVGVNGTGRRTSMTDTSGSTGWTYDSRGRLILETKTISGYSYSTQFAYNSADLLTATTYPDGEVVTNEYNSRMLLNALTGTNSYVTGTAYDEAGRITQRSYGNETVTNYGYYPWNGIAGTGGRLQYTKSGVIDPNNPGSQPTSLQSLEYSYDPASNVSWIKDYKMGSPQTQTFTYDSLNRLTAAVATGGTYGLYNESYGYDASTGNLISKAGIGLTYGDTNHKHAATSAGNTSYVYDNNGGLTTRTTSGQSAYTFLYDAEGHIVEVKQGGTTISTFKYDGDGKRVQSVVNGVTTLFVGLVEIENPGTVQTLPPVFSDVPAGYWAKAQIEGLYNLGLLSSCATNPLRYCPSTNVTRIDAIRDILRVEHGDDYIPPAATHNFADMAGNPLEPWADQAYSEGLTSGCTTTPQRNFCPNNTITRAEIVIFLLRAKHGGSYTPPAASHYFADMNGNWAEAWADQAYREGITTGCSINPRNFCPTSVVTRDTNAVFLENAFHKIANSIQFSYSGVWRKYYMAGTQRVAMRTCEGGSGTANCSAPTYLLGDHLGSTSLSVDNTGLMTSQLLYKPWGEVRYNSATSMPTKYTFTGQYSYMDDPATTAATEGFGLMFYNARWYDPALGRFAQADTITPGGAQGLDRYAYSNNSPIVYADPSGHMPCNGENCSEDGYNSSHGHGSPKVSYVPTKVETPDLSKIGSQGGKIDTTTPYSEGGDENVGYKMYPNGWTEIHYYGDVRLINENDPGLTPSQRSFLAQFKVDANARKEASENYDSAMINVWVAAGLAVAGGVTMAIGVITAPAGWGVAVVVAGGVMTGAGALGVYNNAMAVGKAAGNFQSAESNLKTDWSILGQLP